MTFVAQELPTFSDSGRARDQSKILPWSTG